MKKERIKRSIIWEKFSKKELEKIVANSNSFSEILLLHDIKTRGGGSYGTLRRRLESENIDYSHILLGIGSNKGRNFLKPKIPLNKILVENSNYNRCHLKRRLMKNGLLKNKCCICGLEPEWEGKNLVMVIDHINGVNNDNRIENLRLICPNCNSQTDTFAGRKLKKRYYCKCGKDIVRGSEKCRKCRNQYNAKVQDRPSKEELERLTDIMSWVSIGKKYGVSDNAVRKWARNYGIIS